MGPQYSLPHLTFAKRSRGQFLGFDPPALLRLDLLQLGAWEDCCVEVPSPRDGFREAYKKAVFGN